MEQVKDPKSMARYSNAVVVKNKRRFTKPLTNTQHKVLRAIEINQKHDTTLAGMSWAELADFVGIVDGTKYSKLKRSRVWKELVELAVEENEMYYPMFMKIGLDENGCFDYLINPEIKEFFEQPDEDYFSNNMEQLKPLSGAYSVPLYELINQQLHGCKKSEEKMRFDITELKKYLGLENNYKDPNDLKKKVLEPSLEEISEKTNIKIEGYINSRTKKINRSSKQSGSDWVYFRRVSRKKTAKEEYNEGNVSNADYKEVTLVKQIQSTNDQPVASVIDVSTADYEYNDESIDAWGNSPEPTPTIEIQLEEEFLTEEFKKSNIELLDKLAKEEFSKDEPATPVAHSIEDKKMIVEEYQKDKKSWRLIANKWNISNAKIKEYQKELSK